MNRVAVEETLTQVKQTLANRGFTVVPLKEADLRGVDAVVVAGQDDDIMGIETTLTKAPVIRANGRSAVDVADRIDRELRIKR